MGHLDFHSRHDDGLTMLYGYADELYEYAVPQTYSFQADTFNQQITTPFSGDCEACVIMISASNNLVGMTGLVTFDVPQNSNALPYPANPSGVSGIQFGTFYTSSSPTPIWVAVDQAIYISAGGGGVLSSSHILYITVAWRARKHVRVPAVEQHTNFGNPDQ